MNIRAKIYGGGGAAEEPILRSKKPKGAKADALDSVTVPRETHRLSNSRGEDRHRLTDERVRITHNGRHIDVELINLSGGGAMVAGSFNPMLWDRVDLHLGNHGTVECAVRWIRDDRVGLEFAHETRLDLPSDQLSIVLRHVIEKTFPNVSFQAPEEAQPAPANEDSEYRAASRHPLIWSGTLHHDYQSDPVRIRNISSSGAMIETSSAVRVGCEPLLELSASVSVSATVEWAIGDQAGLRFHSPFDMNMLAQVRPAVASNTWCPPDYLNLESPNEDHWGRLSLPELCAELEGFLKR